MSAPVFTRRAVVSVAGGVACAAALAACSAATSAGPAASPQNPSTGGSGTGGSGAPSGALATTAEIPVGGGMVFGDQDVVVTQPTAGQFKAFSATCTHQGCLVDQVADGTIDCPCHGSEYSVTDGSVVRGPAPLPLPQRTIRVEGDAIHLA